MQAVGVLPSDLAWIAHIQDGRETAAKFFSFFERHNMPEEMYDEILEAFGGPPDSGPRTKSSPPADSIGGKGGSIYAS
jgi:hypothetical protein